MLFDLFIHQSEIMWMYYELTLVNLKCSKFVLFRCIVWMIKWTDEVMTKGANTCVTHAITSMVAIILTFKESVYWLLFLETEENNVLQIVWNKNQLRSTLREQTLKIKFQCFFTLFYSDFFSSPALEKRWRKGGKGIFFHFPFIVPFL